MPSKVKEFVASIGGRNNRNKGEWFVSTIADPVHTTFWSNNYIPSFNGQVTPRRLRLVIALTGENRPGVLPCRMDVGSNSLAWPDVPRDDHGLSGLSDHRPYRLIIVRRLHELEGMKKAVATHDTYLA